MDAHDDSMQTLLPTLLRARIPPAAWTWLEDIRARLDEGAQRELLLTAYAGVPRRTGRARIELTDDEGAAVAALDAEANLSPWTTADLGRAVLLQTANAAAAGDSRGLVLAPLEEGDSDEQQSWLRALPLLPAPERFLEPAIDTCRTNILPQFEAIACENPYPARFFPELNFNQLVLKSLFNSIALERIVGLHRRFNPELSRMADDYVSEREAAGRSVPADVWVVIGPHPTPARLERLQRYLRHDDAAHRHWASVGLSLASASHS